MAWPTREGVAVIVLRHGAIAGRPSEERAAEAMQISDAILALFEPLRAELEALRDRKTFTVIGHCDDCGQAARYRAELEGLRADLAYASESWSLLDRKHQELTGDLEALLPVARAALMWEMRSPSGLRSLNGSEGVRRVLGALDPALRARLLEGK